jgi:hypothetical protein
MGKSLLIKTAMGKSPNEMSNCLFASPLVAPLHSILFVHECEIIMEYSSNLGYIKHFGNSRLKT